MQIIDMRQPVRLYRYSKYHHLTRSLLDGSFRLSPASAYKDMLTDVARQDDEQVRIREVAANDISMMNQTTGAAIRPIGQVKFTKSINTNYYVLCLSESADDRMYELFKDTNSCLIIRNPDKFCERLHAAVAKALPNWGAMDAPIAYGTESPFGAVFEKDVRYFPQREWRFAWMPSDAMAQLPVLDVRMGSIEDIAEITRKPNNGKEG